MVPDIGQTALFACVAFQFAFCAIFLSGMYPVAARVTTMQRGGGSTLVALCVLTTIPLIGGVIWIAGSIEWPFLVIAGGLAFLLSPLIYQAFPLRISEGPLGATVLFLANSLLLAIIAQQLGAF